MQYGPLVGFRIGERDIIIAHPLWDTDKPRGLLSEAIAAASTKPRFLDTFNMLRRESWAYQSLKQSDAS
jgi:hypothetical protein